VFIIFYIGYKRKNEIIVSLYECRNMFFTSLTELCRCGFSRCSHTPIPSNNGDDIKIMGRILVS